MLMEKQIKKMLGHNRHFAILNCSCYLLIIIVNGKSLPIYLKILNLIKIKLYLKVLQVYHCISNFCF